MARKFRSKKLSGQVRASEKLAEVAQKLEICFLHSNYCLPRTNAVTTFHCEEPFDSETYAEQIAQLKADLHEALKTIEAHEKDVSATVKKASALALDELEAGLKDFLREVDQRRKNHERSG